MKKSILLTMFISFGLTFMFSGCSKDEATKVVEDLTQNSAPIAIAQTITVAQDSVDNNIALSGSDTDGDALTFIVETNTTNGTLSGTTPNLKYTPSASYGGTDSFTFKVNDGTDDSPTATINITVNPPGNQLPIAKAGIDQNIILGDEVTFDGSSSTDDGTIESYVWYENITQLSTQMSFTKRDFTIGTHTITLIVTDNQSATHTDTVVVTVTAISTSPASSSLLKTGQTTSYKDFDDGYYQTGLSRSYTRDDVNNIVTDNTTGLVWQDDTTPATMIWDDALTYCSDLTLGGFTDWRLPSRKELVSLSDYGRYSPAIDPVFQNTISGFYWSSTTGANKTSYAWYVSFSNGSQSSLYKTYNRRSRCVRAGQ